MSKLVWGPDLPLLLCTYLLLIGFLGYYSSRRGVGVTVKDFFVANKLLGYAVLGLGLFATVASGNTFLGYSAKAYRSGLSFLVAPAFYVSILVGLLVLGSRLVPLATRKEYVTPGDYLLDRFGSRPLTLFLLTLMICSTFIQFLEQSIAMGYVGEVASAGYIPYSIATALFTGVVLAVTLMGGFRGTALANSVMGAVMVTALLGVLLGIIPLLGGQEAIKSLASNPAMAAKLVLPPKSLPTWGSTVVLVMFGTLSYLQVWMFVLATKDLRTLRRQYLFAPAIYTLVPTTFVIMGLVGLAVFPGLTRMESERIVPMLIDEAAARSPLGYVLGELTYVAIVSATLSTAAATVFSLGAVLAKDIYSKFVNPGASEEEVVRASKVAVALLAVGGYLASLTSKLTLWEWIVLKLEIGMQAVPPLILSLHVRWVSVKGAWVGVLAGLAATAALRAAGYSKVLGIHAGVVGFLINAALTALTSYVLRSPAGVNQ